LGDEKLKHEERSPVCIPKRKDVAVSELEKALTEQAATITSLQKQNAELHQQNDSLSMELSNMQKEFEQLKDQLKQATSVSSERRLRDARCGNSSMDDLKQAIDASEALLNEAMREHANKKFRAKLDLERTEEELNRLRAMRQEKHAAKAARGLLQKQKKIAFTLVEKDDVMKFKELIDEVGEGISWCDWRDSLGRTVLCCAKDLRVPRMQEFLKQLGVGEITCSKSTTTNVEANIAPN